MNSRIFTLNGKALKISLKEDSNYPGMSDISKFRKNPEIGKIQNIIKVDEFFEDLEYQINFLQNKPLSVENALDAFLASCDHHISRFNRIIDQDLESYLDTILILVCAISDSEKMVPLTELQGQELRETFCQCGYKAFQNYLYIHVYDGNSSMASPRLVKYSNFK